MMVHFWKALVDKMRADTGAGGLVSLTGDTSSDRHIGRGIIVEENPKYPYIGVFDDDDKAAIADAYTGYKMTTVKFEIKTMGATVAQELICLHIADRIENLLHQHNKQQHLQWWNISNNDILNHWTNFNRRDVATYNEKDKTWMARVFGEFRWNLKNPPNLP